MKIQRILAILALSALTLTAFAQSAGPTASQGSLTAKPAKGQRKAGVIRDDKILSELNLTDDQKTKIKDLKKKVGDELKESWQKDKDDKEKLKEDHKTAMKAYHDGLKEILTKQQASKYAAIVKENREKRKLEGKGGSDKPAAPAAPATPASKH